MAVWQDTTIRLDAESTVDVVPDPPTGGKAVHVTWHEEGVSFTLVVPETEAKSLCQKLHDALKSPAVAIIVTLVAALQLLADVGPA